MSDTLKCSKCQRPFSEEEVDEIERDLEESQASGSTWRAGIEATILCQKCAEEV